MKRGVIVRWAATFASCVMLTATAFGQTAPQQPAGASQSGAAEEVRALTPGAPAVEREMAGGVAHSYRVTLSAGQFLRVEVEQRGIDLILILRGPGGSEALAEMDGYSTPVGMEEIVWEATTAGEHVLEVRALSQAANAGRYAVRAEVTAEASTRGRAWVEAQRLFMEGRRAQAEGGGASLERAAQAYARAAERWRAAGERKWEGRTFLVIGNVYFYLSQYERAREHYERALVLRREIGDRRGVGLTLNNLGAIHQNLRQYERARVHYEQVLLIFREVGDRKGEGGALSNLGLAYFNLNQQERGRDYYEQALAILREVGDRRSEAETLYRMARISVAGGDLAVARTHAEAALVLVESIRAGVAGSEARLSFLASFQDYYSLHVNVLMRLHAQEPAAGHDATAFEVSERGRARTLLELLTEARADIRQGVDSELVERERALQRQLNNKATQQVQLLATRHTPEQAAAIETEVATLTNQYQDLQAQIRRTNPRYAALTQPQPLSVREIQSQVLDADTLLLEYSLGEERSYLWAVTRDSLTSYVLPGRAEVEAAARRVYELLTARQPRAGESVRQRQQRVATAEAEYARAATALSRMLIAPATELLPRYGRLVVVAEGALNYVPFAALPPPNARGESVAALVETHEVVSLPSASALAVLRRETAGRRHAARAVAVIADPVFSTDDERVRGAGGTTPVQQPVAARGTETHGQGAAATVTSSPRNIQLPEGLARSLETTRGGSGSDGSMRSDLARLVFSRREAEAIYTSVPRGAALRALDFQASRQTVTSPDLAQYRYIHFATHGLLNSQRPELSGVVLSLVDERGQPQDGFLRLHEVYNLNLPAELVVLSACQTGLGQEVRGEGLVGLTRGFMYAGARRVVASLWQVDDLATAELMRRFYTKMLRERQTPAAALRAAQVELRSQRQWRSPYYWAGFILQGEWR